MPDAGFNVSVRDVYLEVKALSDLIHEDRRERSSEIAVLKTEMNDVKEDVKDIRAKAEDGKKTRTSLQWQMAGVFLGAVLAAVLPLVVK